MQGIPIQFFVVSDLMKPSLKVDELSQLMKVIMKYLVIKLR